MAGSNAPVLMLTEKAGHALGFFDLATGAAAARIDLPPFPHEFAVDPDGRYAYVAQYGVRTSTDAGEGGAAVLVVDIAERRLVRRIDCAPYRRPHGITFDGRGRLLVLSEAADTLLVFDAPLTAETPSALIPTGGRKSHLVVAGADGAWAYCSNLESGTVTRIALDEPAGRPRTVSPGARPEALLLSADGRRLLVSNRGSATLAVIDTETMAVLAEAPTRPDPARLYAIGDGRVLVANYENRSLSIVDQGSLRETGFLELPGRPAAACFAPGTGHAFVSVDSGASIEIDLEALGIVRVIPTGPEPDCCSIVHGP